LRSLFKLLTNKNLNVKINNLQIKSILGIKFIIQGRLQGKPRASNNIILIGSVPTQAFQKNIDYSLNHIYTKLGAFGIKLWIHKNNFA
jgi:ribosomal protein S3